MRIVVVGNCQAHGVAVSTAQFLPQADVQLLTTPRLADPAHRAANLEIIRTADLILRQEPLPPPFAAWTKPVLEAARSKTVEWPAIVFGGFHPDQFSLTDPEGAFVLTPTGAYNSIITAACYAAGLSAQQARSRFNSLSYAQLGYFDRFSEDMAAVGGYLRDFGMDFEALVQRWLPHGSFMHTYNHPTVRPLVDIARHALARADIALKADPAGLPYDIHAVHSTPVFPELARRLGVPGGLSYTTGPNGETLSLDEFVAGSFERYAALAPGVFGDHPMVRRAAELLGLDIDGPSRTRVRQRHDRYLETIRWGLGETIDCSQPRIAPYLGPGWGPPEPGHGCWTVEPDARLRLIVEPATDGPLALILLTTPLLRQQRPRLRVEVAVNGVDLTVWKFRWRAGGEWTQYERRVVVPARLARGGDLELTLRV